MYGTPPGAGREPRTPLESPAQPRPLGPEHLELCLALDQRSLGGLWSPAQWRTELIEPERPGIGLWHGSCLVAMACGWLILEELHITLIAVDPLRRRQGLGFQALEALLTEGHRRGAERATLEVACSNAAAQALYTKAGFQQAGRRRGYYRNGDDALIQWLKIST